MPFKPLIKKKTKQRIYLVDRPVREKNALLQKLPRQPLRIKKRTSRPFENKNYLKQHVKKQEKKQNKEYTQLTGQYERKMLSYRNHQDNH
jgi:hypothetical protein